MMGRDARDCAKGRSAARAKPVLRAARVHPRISPPPKRRGRPRKTDLREVVNAFIRALRSGCSWRMLPHDLPPWQTVYTYFRTWKSDGTLERVHDALRAEVRRNDGRNPEPGAAIIDSRSAQTTESGESRV